jgi:stage III sporulation protein AF
MAMLILWLKKIILLVLLATFLDLLLPSNTYSKYVKLVMGLLILLSLLSPLLELFRQDVSFAQLSFAIGENGEKSPDFARVDALAKKLATENDAEANRYVEAQISELVKKQIESEQGVVVQTVHVKISPQGQKAKQPIERISVVLAQKKKENDSKDQDGQSTLVEPMKPVKVEMMQNDDVKHSSGKEESVAVVAKQTGTEKKIAAAVSAAWDVPSDAVQVTWTEAGEGG